MALLCVQIFGEAGYPAGGERGRRRGRSLRAGRQKRTIDSNV